MDTFNPASSISPVSLLDDNERAVYMAADLAEKIFHHVGQLRHRNGALCDFSIHIGDVVFHGHRIVLSIIPYFEGLFNSHPAATEVRIDPNIISDSTFNTVINFLYSGHVVISAANVESLMHAADYFQFEELTQQCAILMQSSICADNALGIRQFAQLHNSPSTIDVVDRFLQKNFLSVADSEEFLELPVEDLVELLSRDELHVESEEQVFEAALRWLLHRFEREEFASRVLAKIRMPLMKKKYLSQMAAHSIIHNSLECRDLVDEAKDYHLVPEQRPFLKKFKIKERCCPDVPAMIYVFGGLNLNYEASSKVGMFDPLTKRWTKVNNSGSLRTRVGVAAFGHQIFVIGGYNGADRLRTVEIYDVFRNEWSDAPPMENGRSAMAVAVCDEHLYACGGFNNQKALRSVEAFDIGRNEWTPQPPMITQRCAAASAVLNGKIYVIGGHNGVVQLDTMECYDPQRRVWETGPPMRSKRCRHGAAVYRDKIYVCGGYDSQSFLRTTEIYDPSTNQWTDGPEMIVRRGRVAVVTSGTSIYAIGGYDGETKVCSMERLRLDRLGDPLRWEMSTSMRSHEGGVGAAVARAFPRRSPDADMNDTNDNID